MDAARRRGALGRLITSLATNSAEPVGGTWPWNRSWLYYTTQSPTICSMRFSIR